MPQPPQLAASRDTRTADEQLADLLAEFYDDPLGYVMFNFPWDTEKSIQLVELQEPYKSRFGCKYGPDVWAGGGAVATTLYGSTEVTTGYVPISGEVESLQLTTLRSE